MLQCLKAIGSQAIAFGLIAGSLQAQDQATTEDQPRQEESVAKGENAAQSESPDPIDLSPALQGIEAAIRELKAEVDKVEQERQQENDRRDLMAQEGMARWAFWMFIASGATVLLTLAALLTIIGTLFQTKRAADASVEMVDQAKASTTAAIKAVEVTREMGIAQTRAYVDVTAASAAEDDISPLLRMPISEMFTKFF